VLHRELLPRLVLGEVDVLSEFDPERGHRLPPLPEPVITAITVTELD
jgi:hypothetical protein